MEENTDKDGAGRHRERAQEGLGHSQGPGHHDPQQPRGDLQAPGPRGRRETEGGRGHVDLAGESSGESEESSQ